MFVEEAKKYHVFPLDASVGARSRGAASEPHRRPHRVGLYAADDRLPQGDSPFLLDTSYSITADIMCRRTVPRA